MEEIWKPAYDFEYLYEISNKARVRNIKTGKILKPYINDNGYYVLRLVCKNGSQKSVKLHRLLMLTFVGPDPERPIVNHINGNKLDLDLSNLEWTTSRENNIHAIKTGLKTFDFMLHDYHVTIDNLDFNARAAIQCSLTHKLYLGKLKVERTDDPFDITSDYVYHRCGIKGREVHALLPSGLELKAKGPANLSRLLHKLGYWKDYNIKRLTKKVSEAALKSNVVSGVKFWFVE